MGTLLPQASGDGWGYRGERPGPFKNSWPRGKGVDRDVDNKKMTSNTNICAKP